MQSLADGRNEPSVKTATKSSFFQVYQQIYIALYDEQQAERMAHHAISGRFVIVPRNKSCKESLKSFSDGSGFLPSSLVDIYKFNEMSNRIARRNPDSKLIFVTGSNMDGRSRVVFLIGCHMMMSFGMDVTNVYLIFKRFDEFFVDKGGSKHHILDSWGAVERAAHVGWIDFEERFNREDDDEGTIDMEEFIHYSRFGTISSKSCSVNASSVPLPH
jgi:hypothetical protein